jgi:hypothetical protein
VLKSQCCGAFHDRRGPLRHGPFRVRSEIAAYCVNIIPKQFASERIEDIVDKS